MKIDTNTVISTILNKPGVVGGGESMMYRSVKVVNLGGWSRTKNRIHKIRSIYGID